LNALAVYVECRELGISPELIKTGLESFRGIKRRQEERGVERGVLVIDDFAHHPTAVRETLKALKLKYPARRLVAVFEPRSATSRRKVFQKEYGEAFDLADEIRIAVAFDQSKIPSDQQFSSQDLVQDLKDRGKSADFFSQVEEGVKAVSTVARSGDVVAVLSNGGFGGFIPKLLDALRSGQ
jgi:UDP-N-acetylmuramate: L-alanyl-gamma-D-glutamyl-meso-diaminopimelate ligase